MSVTEIQLYKTLQSKLGDAAALELVNYVKAEINSEFMDCKQVFLTKDDKVEIINTITNQKVELISIITNQKAELIGIINHQRTELISYINNQKVDLIKTITDQKAELISYVDKQKVDLINTINSVKADLLRTTIYIVNIVQFLAIIGSLITLVSFFMKQQ